VPLEFLLAASQGCLVGLNLVETPANFSRFLSGHAAMFPGTASEPPPPTTRNLEGAPMAMMVRPDRPCSTLAGARTIRSARAGRRRGG